MTRLVKLLAAGAVAAALLAASASTVFAAPSHATTAARGSATEGVVVVRTRLAFGGGAGAATGIVLTSSGTVLTNNHVIRGAGSITVTVPATGRSYSATVVGYSVSKDVALLRLRNAHGLQTVQTGNSNTVHIGDTVTAVGNGGGSGVLSVKSGKVTGLGQSITVSDDNGPVRMVGLIETTTSLRPGDSGGPLLSGGRVVGIDAARTASFYYEDSHQGYAIPINRALAIARQIQSGRGSSTVHVGPTAFLGVGIRPPAGGTGALVDTLAPGSPAARAGIGENDIITAFAGKHVSSPTRLRQLVLHSRPGQVVRVTWIDAYEGTTSATVRLAAGPPQ